MLYYSLPEILTIDVKREFGNRMGPELRIEIVAKKIQKNPPA